MSKQVMQQALEALENSVDLTEGEYTEAVRMYGHYPTRKGKLDGLKAFADAHQAAIKTLRQAIEQGEAAEPVAWVTLGGDAVMDGGWDQPVAPEASGWEPLFLAPGAQLKDQS
jgi:hypothetical protein